MLGVSACGDSGQDGNREAAQVTEEQTTQRTTETAPGAEQPTKRDSKAGEERAKEGSGGENAGSAGETGADPRGAEKLKLENSEPAPTPPAQQRGDDQDLPRGAPTPKSDLKPQDRSIYETSRFFCRQTGIEGMRREYGIEGSDPEEIAREAVRRTYGRGGAEAVYSGCLTGLRQAG